jgi:hypothetical protein
VVPEQSAFELHWTQSPAGLQIGAVVGQLDAVTHCTHPRLALHISPFGQLPASQGMTPGGVEVGAVPLVLLLPPHPEAAGAPTTATRARNAGTMYLCIRLKYRGPCQIRRAAVRRRAATHLGAQHGGARRCSRSSESLR